jgi:Ca2+-binding EF-hand superfamily protein
MDALERLETMPDVILDEANILGVIGLQGALAEYNGQMTRNFEKLPLKEGSDQLQYRVTFEQPNLATPGTTQKIELVLTAKNLKGTLDVGVSGADGWYQKQQLHDFASAGNKRRRSFALNNRSSVKISVENIASQISKNVSMSEQGIKSFFGTNEGSKQAIKDMLHKDLHKDEFFGKIRDFKLSVERADVDKLFAKSANEAGIVSLVDGVEFLVANMGLNKIEFLQRVRSIGITVNPKDVDLLFPMIDESGDGIVSVKEFMQFFSKKGDRRSSDLVVLEMTKVLRKDRIQKKTDLQKNLVEISERLRTSLVKYAAVHKLTTAQLFNKIDWDGSGSIDRTELTMAIPTLGIDISQEQMNVIWPLFNLDAFGEIKAGDWAKFIQGREMNFEFMQDRFVELSGTEQRAPRPPSGARPRRHRPVSPRYMNSKKPPRKRWQSGGRTNGRRLLRRDTENEEDELPLLERLQAANALLPKRQARDRDVHMETKASKRRQRSKHPLAATEISRTRHKQMMINQGKKPIIHVKYEIGHEAQLLPRLPPITLPQAKQAQKHYTPTRPERLPKNITYTQYPYTYR